jgi:hypothetical protein
MPDKALVLALIHPWEAVEGFLSTEELRDLMAKRDLARLRPEARAAVGAVRARLYAHLDAMPQGSLDELTTRGVLDGVPSDLQADVEAALANIANDRKGQAYFRAKGSAIVGFAAKPNSLLAMPHRGSLDVMYHTNGIDVLVNGTPAGKTGTRFPYATGSRWVSLSDGAALPTQQLVSIRPYVVHVVQFN